VIARVFRLCDPARGDTRPPAGRRQQRADRLAHRSRVRRLGSTLTHFEHRNGRVILSSAWSFWADNPYRPNALTSGSINRAAWCRPRRRVSRGLGSGPRVYRCSAGDTTGSDQRAAHQHPRQKSCCCHRLPDHLGALHAGQLGAHVPDDSKLARHIVRISEIPLPACACGRRTPHTGSSWVRDRLPGQLGR
jgi:hypothetical protein